MTEVVRSRTVRVAASAINNRHQSTAKFGSVVFRCSVYRNLSASSNYPQSTGNRPKIRSAWARFRSEFGRADRKTVSDLQLSVIISVSSCDSESLGPGFESWRAHQSHRNHCIMTLRPRDHSPLVYSMAAASMAISEAQGSVAVDHQAGGSSPSRGAIFQIFHLTPPSSRIEVGHETGSHRGKPAQSQPL
jgi:hypothetical protein